MFFFTDLGKINDFQLKIKKNLNFGLKSFEKYDTTCNLMKKFSFFPGWGGLVILKKMYTPVLNI